MFSSVLEQYTYFNDELDRLTYTIALEAENESDNKDFVLVNKDNDIDDSVNKSNVGEGIFDRIKQIIEKIMALIERYLYQIKNLLKRILLTDKGFKDELRNAEVNNRPLNGIKVITYSYVPELLDGAGNKFKKVILSLINNIKTDVINNEENNPLVLSKSDFNDYIFKQLNAPSNIEDMNVYFKYIREKFRGNKAEKTIMSSSLPGCIKMAEDYKKIEAELERDLSYFKTKVLDIRTNLKVASKSPNITDEEKRKLITKMSNLSYMYNMYFSFVNIILELKIEMILHARVIIKKFYQM
jgi:hypothetical protein